MISKQVQFILIVELRGAEMRGQRIRRDRGEDREEEHKGKMDGLKEE